MGNASETLPETIPTEGSKYIKQIRELLGSFGKFPARLSAPLTFRASVAILVELDIVVT